MHMPFARSAGPILRHSVAHGSMAIWMHDPSKNWYYIRHTHTPEQRNGFTLRPEIYFMAGAIGCAFFCACDDLEDQTVIGGYSSARGSALKGFACALS